MQCMQGMRLSLCVQTELFPTLEDSKVGSLYLSHTAGLYTTWAASFHKFIITSLTSSPSFTSFVASTGYEALFSSISFARFIKN